MPSQAPSINSKTEGDLGGDPVTHRWRIHTRLPDRFGQACRVLARGALNTILVEFGDGYKVATSRNYVTRIL